MFFVCWKSDIFEVRIKNLLLYFFNTAHTSTCDSEAAKGGNSDIFNPNFNTLGDILLHVVPLESTQEADFSDDGDHLCK